MSNLPDYIAEAKPAPLSSRAPWYKTIAPTYAGIMLWFVFWQDLVKGQGTLHGVLSMGLGPAFLGLLMSAMICHFFFYLVPGMLGMQTGLPLYVVGSSTYGASGSRYMPGLLMGLLQFGWLAVNGWAVAAMLCKCFNVGLTANGADVQMPGLWHGVIATVYIFFAAFIGLKGIKYVASVATWLPLIPLAILIVLLYKTFGGIAHFVPNKLECRPEQLDAAAQAIAAGAGNAGLEFGGVLAAICTYVVGFFATAGAAGTDIASAARNENDVHFGGIFGIMFSTLLAGGAAILIVAGAYGSYEPGAANSLISAAHVGSLNPVDFLKDMLGENVGNLALIGLAISSFPGACFSALIAANSFKTTLPKINPFSSVGLGALVAAILAVTGIVAKVIGVFQVIGASFGPICGAMMADFLLAGKKWSGPRAGFNPAGWISWAVGFAVGAFNLVAGSLTDRFPDLIAWKDFVPAPPVAAFIVGFVLYLGLSLIGARTKTLDMPQSPAA